MDPKACIDRMMSHYKNFRLEAARWCVIDLKGWIERNGYEPDMTEDERACYDALCELLKRLGE